MEKLKKAIAWIGSHTSLSLTLLFGLLATVIKLLWDRNASLKSENVAAEAKGQLHELKKEDESETKTTNDAVSDYNKLRDEYLRKR